MQEGCYSIYKTKSSNKEMILAQVFASLSMEGAIKVVICLLDAIKMIHISKFLLNHWEVNVLVFWYSSGVCKDISNTM